MQIFLRLAYTQKKEAKAIGAKWDIDSDQWYVDDLASASKAIWWMEESMSKALGYPHKETPYEKEQREILNRGKKGKKQLPEDIAKIYNIHPQEDHKDAIHIHTDGSCNYKTRIGGWGWVRSDGLEGCGRETNTTNNRMEMQAIIEALCKLPNGQSAVIYSDSQYCVKGLTIWRNGWKKLNWIKKGVPMINRDLWLELERHINRLKFDFYWVKGHNGDAMNERADALANMGAMGHSLHKDERFA